MKSQRLQRARVVAVHRDLSLLRLGGGERTAPVAGRFRFEAQSKADFPAVGDWALATEEGDDGAVIHALLPRHNVLSRKSPGKGSPEQILAANVDVAFIVTSFNEDFNPRRLERYLALVREANVEPAIILNKADLAGPQDTRLVEAGQLSGDAPVFRVSAATGEGVDAVRARLADRTGIFLGSSGVGKSAIVNRLLGESVQATQEIRLSDGRGRHTTTARQMFSLPNGGAIIDTPGLREIGLFASEETVAEIYGDVARIAAQCRFRDCTHNVEGGCAIKDALASGALDRGRWAGFVKLSKERAYLKRKADPAEEARNRKKWRLIHKQIRDLEKNRWKR